MDGNARMTKDDLIKLVTTFIETQFDNDVGYWVKSISLKPDGTYNNYLVIQFAELRGGFKPKIPRP